MIEDFAAQEILKRVQTSMRVSDPAGTERLEFQALGTNCQITMVGTPTAIKDFTQNAIHWVAAFEAKYSRFLPHSLISRINAAAGQNSIALDAEAEALLALCDKMYILSQGVLDPSVLPLLTLWNWKTSTPIVPSDEAVYAALDLVGWHKVTREPGMIFLPKAGMGLDLGGMGKEYAVDHVALLAETHGLSGALINFGADIRVFGLPADGRQGWHIGLENPHSPGTAWCGLAVRNAAVATSGDYFRRFEINGVRYGHILDPRTGRPTANGIRAVSIIAPSCLHAGLLSTSAQVLGEVEGLELINSTPGAAGAILTDTKILRSRNFSEYVAA